MERLGEAAFCPRRGVALRPDELNVRLLHADPLLRTDRFPAASQFVRGAIDKYCGLWMEGGTSASAPLAKRCAVPLATKDACASHQEARLQKWFISGGAQS